MYMARKDGLQLPLRKQHLRNPLVRRVGGLSNARPADDLASEA
jgi:hypothetical protein